MTDLIQEIQSAKVRAAEDVVLQHLESIGLGRVSPSSESDPTGRTAHDHEEIESQIGRVMFCPEDVHLAAMEVWGVEANVRRFAEECGECVAALNRYIEGRVATCLPLASEVADLRIMLERIEYVVGGVNAKAGGPVDSRKFAEWVDAELRSKILRTRLYIEDEQRRKVCFEQTMEAIA